MNKLLGIIFILSFVSCQNEETVERSKFKTIMIKSYGEVETLPDMATFHIDLDCLDKNIKVSKNCLIDKSNELIEKLQSFGIIEDDILTTSVNMSKSYTWRNSSNVFEGYRSSTTVFITIRNIEKLNEIYTELLGNQNLYLSGLNYSHTKLDSLKNEAYVNALDKSGMLADRLLDKLPESNKEILKIGNIEISASTPQVNESKNEALYKMENNMISGNKSIAISKGTVRVNATLFVEYQIK